MKLMHPKSRKSVMVDLGDGDSLAIEIAAIPGYKMEEFMLKANGGTELSANREVLALGLANLTATADNGEPYPVEIDATTGLVARATIDSLPVLVAAKIAKEVLAANGFGAKDDAGKS